MRYLNLTLKRTTPDQRDAGLVDLSDMAYVELLSYMDFQQRPTKGYVLLTAARISELAADPYCLGTQSEEFYAERAVIEGPPWLMAPLADALRDVGIVPYFEFREFEDREPGIQYTQGARSFHAGFIEAYDGEQLSAKGEL